MSNLIYTGFSPPTSPLNLSNIAHFKKCKVNPINFTQKISTGCSLHSKPLKNVTNLRKPRKIISATKNETPTVTHHEDLKEAITEHAHLRIQLFYLSAMAIYKRALRSDGSFTDVKVKVTGATMQISQGNRENHAAHASAAASTVDNLKELIILQIQKEALTPLKSKLLSAMGLSEIDLNTIDQNHDDLKFVNKMINTYWPHESLLAGSEIELTLNTTNNLPAGLNLGCDLSLEKKIRPLIAEIIGLVMKGQLEPQEATKRYVTAVQEHFKEKITHIENQLLICPKEKLVKMERQLFYHRNELAGSQSIDFRFLNQGFESFEDPQKIDSVATLILLKRRA